MLGVLSTNGFIVACSGMVSTERTHVICHPNVYKVCDGCAVATMMMRATCTRLCDSAAVFFVFDFSTFHTTYSNYIQRPCRTISVYVDLARVYSEPTLVVQTASTYCLSWAMRTPQFCELVKWFEAIDSWLYLMSIVIMCPEGLSSAVTCAVDK